MRNIELKRNGKLVGTLDIYDLLLDGDTSDDAQLQSADVIFIPPADVMVGIDGEVRRPAIYELRSERTVADVIDLAGGLLPTADTANIQLERVMKDGRRRVETLNLDDPESLRMAVQGGDLIRVFPVLATMRCS